MRARMRMISLCMLLSITACLDYNGDGKQCVSVGGNSNTMALFTGGVGSWVEPLAARHPNVIFNNLALSGTSILGPGGGMDQLQQAVSRTPQPDVFIIASGTIDVTQEASAEQIFGDLQILWNAAKEYGVTPYIATIPPIFVPDCSGPHPQLQPVINAVNVMIRGYFPPKRIIDFDSGLDCWTDYGLYDGVHIITATGEPGTGQDKRLASAELVLFPPQ